MPAQYQIAIVGPLESIIAFHALGVEIVPCANQGQVVSVVRELLMAKITTAEGEASKYAVIFLSEELAQAISGAEYQELTKGVLPAIVPLPGPAGSTGFGAKRLGQIVERAIGSNILANQ